MMQDFFKPKYQCIQVLIVFLFTLLSCNNNGEQNAKNVDDSITYTDNNNHLKPEDVGSFNNLPKSTEETEKAERQKMILMQIDSTYTAIALLDDAKNEMTATSPAELTVAERNKKSKAIFNINILQNELTRALDASILANLRLKTDELAGITAELAKNVGHLQTVTEKLNKATLCIGRLTNLLALGLSKGFIKPLTPKGASAAAIKAATTN
jgi:hypothetical protein